MLPQQSAVTDDRLSVWVAGVLRVGNTVTMLLLSVGTLLALIHRGQGETRSHTLPEVWQRLLHAQPGGLIEIGLHIMVLTPIVVSLFITLFALFGRARGLLIPCLLITGGIALGIWIGLVR